VSHDEAQSLLAAYAAGTLAEAEAEGVRAHLASGCIQCLTSVFARPVGLPRDLPIVHAPPPPTRGPWRGRVMAAALIAGVAGAVLVLSRGDAPEERWRASSDVAPAPTAETLATVPRVPEPARERSARLDAWDDETPIIRAREEEDTTTSTAAPPAETTTSTLPVDGAAEPIEAPVGEMVVASGPDAVATSTPSTAEPVPSTALPHAAASPPPTDEPQAAIPTIPPGEIERARLRSLLERERAELDERTRELEEANRRARAAEAETVEQAAARAALEAELSAARRRADALERKQLSAPPPHGRRAESAAGDAMLASPGARLLSLRPVGPFHDVRGHVVWRPGTEGVVVYGFGLPTLPHGRTYNVRVDVGSGEAITIPRLRPDDRGRLIVPVRLPPGAQAVSSVRIARDLDGDAVLAGGVPASTVR